ncbi:MAG: hypothetical protein RL148_1006 [Planctomycetota bacterium]|jgi:hypothetical protein
MKLANPTLFLALLAVSAACAPNHYRASVSGMSGRMSGDIALQNTAGTNNLETDRNDLKSNFGLGESEVLPYLQTEATWDAHTFRFNVFDYSSDGSGTLAEPFGDIPAGSTVDAALDFTALQASWTYDVLDSETLHFGPGAQLAYYRLDLSAQGGTPAGYEEIDSETLIPQLYLEGEIDLGTVSFVASAGGMSVYQYHDADGSWWDTQFMLRVQPFDHFELVAGYRLIDMDANGIASSRDFDVDARFEGWFVGAGLRF